MTVTLEQMNAEEFEGFLVYSIKHYAEEHVKAGNWEPQEAMDKAAQEYEKLLPEGVNTENNHLYTIKDGSREVGMIWLAQATKEKGFIYSINIWDENQGKGYGKQAMREIEIIAKSLGMKSIGLHVFGHNEIARSLYEKVGYIEKNIKMEKTL